MKRLITLIVLLSIFFSLQAYAATQVAAVRIGWHSADKVRFVFDLKGDAAFRISTLKNPDRILVRFAKAKSALKFSRKALKMGWVRRIRTGFNRRGDFLVVLDLAKAARYKYFTLNGRRAGEKRLVVDVLRPGRVLARAKTAPKATRPKAQVMKKTAPVRHVAAVKVRQGKAVRTMVDARQQPDRGASRKAAVQKRRIQQEILHFTRRPLDDNELIIAIDAGHGGKDTGAIGPGGVREKDVTLAMAWALKRRIDAEPGMRAVLIRKGDEFVPLYDRPRLAKKYNADLFISIHADAFPHDRRVRGGSIYVLNEKGASSTMAKALARNENGSIFLNAQQAPEKVAYVLGDLTRKANLRASRKLAGVVLQEMARKVRMHKLSVQSANFAVLRSLEMPSILIETAFISNPSDIRNLRSKRFRRQMAEAIVKGVKRFAAKRARQPHWGETLFVDYRVKRGDTLSEIAQRFGTRVSTLRRVNRLRNADLLYVGKRLKVPVSEKLLAAI